MVEAVLAERVFSVHHRLVLLVGTHLKGAVVRRKLAA